MIYTELLDMVEAQFGEAMVDDLIDAVGDRLESGGAYTSVGNYPHEEIVTLVVELSSMCDVPVPDLVRGFGSYLFHRFGDRYPELVGSADDVLGFLELVEGHIHAQVLMLYPAAQLPTFVTERRAPEVLVMDYRSERAFGDLAHGLILGCADHFGEQVTIDSEPLGGAISGVRFTISRHA